MKIDLVYLWVNGNDPEWLKKRDKYKYSLDTNNKEACSECRYFENDELKFSLRSVEKFASWINRIFIVTDNQVPSWLDTSNPKITIVDHTEILPKEVLPTFNSTVIELGLANIPELSENFLYANDDTLIAKSVTLDFFFNKDEKPIVRLRKRNLMYYKYLKKGSDYAQIVYKSIKTIKRDFGKTYRFAPHHNIDAYNKSTYKECLERYNEWVQTSISNRFRTPYDIPRNIVTLYSLANNSAILRQVDRNNRVNTFCEKVKCWFTRRFGYDSKHILINTKDYNKVFRKCDPILFCMNDNHNASDEDRRRARKFLEDMFPQKSSFEK